MIDLYGRATLINLIRPLGERVFRLSSRESFQGGQYLLTSDGSLDRDREVFLLTDEKPLLEGIEYVVAPSSMNYLKEGDIVALSSEGKSISALWRGNGSTNTILLTERCDNLCLMCSQPPKEKNDDWLLRQAFDLVSLMPRDAREIGITGGEPTLYGDRFNDLVSHISMNLPETALHILSNGRRFADPVFAANYAERANDLTMVGIPIYGSEPKLHDYVVQASGAFEETINGILNLGELGQAIEIRVVLHAITAPRIVDIAEYIVRNLAFVDQVALMGLEMMGFARKNQDLLWIDPLQYGEQLAEATELLAAHGVHTLIYNHQLCLLHRDLWKYAVQSISDWKNEYDPVCQNCDLLERCGGFFHSAKYGSSGLIQPLNADGTPKKSLISTAEIASESHVGWKRRLIPVTGVTSD